MLQVLFGTGVGAFHAINGFATAAPDLFVSCKSQPAFLSAPVLSMLGALRLYTWYLVSYSYNTI